VADVREVARRELARRELARRRLMDFTTYTFAQYQVARHNQLLAEYLEQVELYVTTRGCDGIGRLMVFMPPRHGKSELVSVRFPAWFLGRNPDSRVILSSCTGDLAMNFGRQVRNIVVDAPFRAVFGDKSSAAEPVALSDDSRSASVWDFAGRRGGMVAAGVGAAIIGRGAHLAIIDDPLRNRQDAESQIVRDRIDEWYKSTLYTRLEDGAAIVLMHQRWHEDDLAGRLLKRQVLEDGADQWVVLNLPALAEEWAGGVEAADVIEACKSGWWRSVDPLGRQPGDPLWPGKYPLDALASIRTNIGGYEWDALYQQRPRRLEGAIIKAHLIKVIATEEIPAGLRVARYWDLAVSGKERADYIAGCKVGRDKGGRLYILDVAHFPGPWADARSKMIGVMLRDEASVEQGIEVSGQQGGYFQELQRDDQLQGRTLRAVNPRDVGNKEVRAQVWASRIEDGLVYMVRAPWNDAFIAEALAFPRGAYDDQVDGVSGAVQMLPSYVSFSEVPQAPSRPSRWDPFGQGRAQWQAPM
jgi:predicted phage terminase large subunit-like protein